MRKSYNLRGGQTSAVPGTEWRRGANPTVGRQTAERFVGNNGEINASSNKELAQSLWALAQAIQSGQVSPNDAVVASTPAQVLAAKKEQQQMIVAAYYDKANQARGPW
jgi:hypothetical protein